MAREHARILSRIWTDEEFCARTSAAQRLYLLMISQSSVNNAGVLPLTIRRWANKAPDTEPEALEKALRELVATFFIVVDEDTEEVLIRSFMRNDGVAKQPKVLINACNVAQQVESPQIREQLAIEFRRIDIDRAIDAADRLDPHQNARPLRLTDTLREASAKPIESPGEPDATTNGVGVGVKSVNHGSGSVSDYVSSVELDAANEDESSDTRKNEKDEPQREEVESICRHLADAVEANGSKRPTITSTWRKDARLMLDRDGREVEKVHNLIDWSQNHHWWRTHVMGMPKFRSEYDKMRLQAVEDHNRKRQGRSGGSRQSASDAAAAQAQSLRRNPRQSLEPDQPELIEGAG